MRKSGQADGQGIAEVAPPLVRSRWVRDDPELLARIRLHGKEGTAPYPSGMPPVGSLDDEQLAAVMTFIRRQWGHTASPVEPELVSRVRQDTTGRSDPWTDAELEAFAR